MVVGQNVTELIVTESRQSAGNENGTDVGYHKPD
jgi:hypothetical protein